MNLVGKLDAMRYSKHMAQMYSKLEVEKTSYAASYSQALLKMKSKSYQTVLDFGCGAGRSIKILKKASCNSIIGIDHNPYMLKLAKENHPDVIFYDSLDNLSRKNIQFELIFCAHVFIEFESKEKIQSICNKLYNLLCPNGKMIVITGNPDSFGFDYISFRHLVNSKNVHSGKRVSCLIKSEKPFKVHDYFWTVEDYTEIKKNSGFEIVSIETPLENGENWINETKIAPHILFELTKTNSKIKI